MAVFTGNGSLAAPSITFSSNTQTGIYRASSDVIGFSTGGGQSVLMSLDGTFVGRESGTRRAQFHVFGTGGNIADGQPQGAVVRISDNRGTGGSGGMLVLCNSQADNANTVGPIALRSFLVDGSSNTRSDLTFNTRTSSVSTSLTECGRISSSGLLLWGTTTAVNDASGSPTRRIQLVGAAIAMGIHRNDVSIGGNSFIFTKAKGPAVETLVFGDVLGNIEFQGANGVGYSNGAQIRAVVDAAVSGGGAADMPTRLEFSVSPDGSATMVQRLIIKSGGAVRLPSSFTVSNLPTPAQTGDLARVTDASAPAIGSTVVGGGAAAALCWYNGANWTVIGV